MADHRDGIAYRDADCATRLKRARCSGAHRTLAITSLMKKILALLVSFLSLMIMFIHRGGGDLALKTGARTVGAAHLSQNHSSINQSNEKRLPHNIITIVNQFIVNNSHSRVPSR